MCTRPLMYAPMVMLHSTRRELTLRMVTSVIQMGDIGRENAWCKSQQTTNGIFRTKIGRTAALDFAAQGIVIGLQTDGNFMGR